MILLNGHLNTLHLCLGVQRTKNSQKVRQGLGEKPVCLRSMLILPGCYIALKGHQACMLYLFV